MPANPLSPAMDWAMPGLPASSTLAQMLAGLRARRLLFFGAALIAIVHILTSFEGNTPYFVSIGTIQIYLFDLLALILGGIGGVLLLRRRRFTSIDFIFLAIVVLSVVQFLRGLVAYSTQAGVEFRQDAFVLCALLFMMGASSFYRHTRRDFLVIVALYAGAGLLVYGIRALGLAPLSVFDLTFNQGIWRAGRFIGADEALGVLGLAMTCFSLAIYGSDQRYPTDSAKSLNYWLYGAIAIIFAFIAMHRSVWAVGILAVPLFFGLQLRYRLMTRHGFEIFFVIALAAILVITVAFLTSASLQNAAGEVSAVNSTLNWRTAGWESLIKLMVPTDYLLGRGYGADYSRWVFGEIIKNSAHNFYLAQLWQFGIVGLALYVVLYISVIASLVRIARRPRDLEDRALATLLIALISGELVFFMVYANWIPSILLMGYALGFVRTKRVAGPSRRRWRTLYNQTGHGHPQGLLC
jgi:O-antigen ligase